MNQENQRIGQYNYCRKNVNPQQNKFQLRTMTIDSQFDSGNLIKAEQINETDVYLWIATDCATTDYEKQYRTWFYFKVYAVEQTTLYYNFVIKNMVNQKHLYVAGMAPVYRNNRSKEWKRINYPINFVFGQLYRQQVNEGQTEHELSFKFKFNNDPNDITYFAFTYPWSYQDDQLFLDNIQTQFQSIDQIYFRRELLIYSLEDRKVELLTITSQRAITTNREEKLKHLFPDNNERPFLFKDKKYVFISARVHPGEIPGSHVFTGMLNYFLEFRHNQQVQLLLDNFVFVMVPMINPDGVSRGHYRVDSLGQNLNRFYMNPTLKDQPSVFAIREYFNYLHKTRILYFYMDLHAHAGKRGIFSFGNSLPYKEHLQTILYNKLIAINNKDYDYEYCNFTEKNMYSKDKSDNLSKEGAGRVALYKQTGLKHCYTLEANYNMSRQYNEVNKVVKVPVQEYKVMARMRIGQYIQQDKQVLELLMKKKGISRDKYVENGIVPYDIAVYRSIGVSILDSLIDLLIHENDLFIPDNVGFIQSRVWSSIYKDSEILKYCLAVDLVKEIPFRFDIYFRNFMKVFQLSNNACDNAKIDQNQIQALKQLDKFIVENIKVQIEQLIEEQSEYQEDSSTKVEPMSTSICQHQQNQNVLKKQADHLQRISIMDLQLNDLIVSAVKDGSYQYEQITGFFHKSTRKAEMLRITLQNGNTIELSNTHLAYIYENQLLTRFAEDLKVGDKMVDAGQEQLEILAIEKIEVDGFVAPITESGNILVNDIQMSTYAYINQPFMTWVMMKPYHWITKLIDPQLLHYQYNSETRNVYADTFQTIFELFVQ